MTSTDPSPVGFYAWPAGLSSVTKLMQLAGSELSQNGIAVVVHRFGNQTRTAATGITISNEE